MFRFSRHRSRTLVKLFLKLGTALLIGPAVNCPISSPVRLLIQKLFWASGEGFKIASCFAPRHDISMPFNFFQILDCHFSGICGQFSWRHYWETRTCNARRAPCILLNLAFHLAAAGCTLQWTFGAEINKQLQILFETTLTLNLRHSDVIVL